MRTQATGVWLALIFAGVVSLSGCQPNSPSFPTTIAPPIEPPTPTFVITVFPTAIRPTSTAVPPLPLPSPYVGEMPDGAYRVLGIGNIQGAYPSPDGSRTAVAAGMQIAIYDTTSFKQQWSRLMYGEPDFGGLIRWSPDGTKVSNIAGRNLFVWDANSGKQLLRLNWIEMYDVPYGGWLNMGWSEDSNLLAVEVDWPFEKIPASRIVVWDSKLNTVEKESLIPLSHFDWSHDFQSRTRPDGVALSFEIDLESVTVRDLTKQTELYHWAQPGYFSEVAWTVDQSKLLATGSRRRDPNEITIWDVATGQPISRELSETVPDGFVFDESTSHVMSPDGTRKLEFANDGSFALYDSAGQLVREFPMNVGCSGPCFSYCWSPDSRRLFGTFKGSLYVWSASTGELIDKIDTPAYRRLLGYSPDGKLLAIEAQNSIVLWNDPY